MIQNPQTHLDHYNYSCQYLVALVRQSEFQKHGRVVTSELFLGNLGFGILKSRNYPKIWNLLFEMIYFEIILEIKILYFKLVI